MTTAEKFSPKTFPTPSDTPTCEQLALELSPGLTLSAADSPARIFPMPESAWALRDHEADYGANITESFASYDRDSLSWKTSQLCLDGELSEFWETWPRAGMTRNGIAFQRAPLAPLTGVIESGLWRTPLARDSHPNGITHPGATVQLAHQVTWPTPRSHEVGDCTYDQGDKTKPRPTLTGLAKMWPTPRATGLDGGSNSRNASKARGMWPTPTAEDSQCKGNHPGAVDSLHAAVKMWPTPTVQDAENNGGPSQFHRNSIPLNAVVKMRATPTQSDGMGGPGYSGRDGGENLRTQIGGQLNPTWVEWLMGYPSGWTVLKDSATPSSRKSRNSSGGGSSKRARDKK